MCARNGIGFHFSVVTRRSGRHSLGTSDLRVLGSRNDQSLTLDLHRCAYQLPPGRRLEHCQNHRPY